MTEAEWLGATDPRKLLLCVSGHFTDRKLRLLAVAFCRHILHLVGDHKQRDGIEVAELCADGLQPITRLKDLYDQAEYTGFLIGKAPMPWTAREYALGASGDVLNPDPHDAAMDTYLLAGFALYPDDTVPGGEPTGILAYPAQVSLIHDVMGNPFRPVAVDPAWLTSDVRILAEGIYQERAFDRMPILADALMDAGCENEDILNHCRQTREHVRGCWVVDLLLGKG